jgi:hypothetical protein
VRRELALLAVIVAAYAISLGRSVHHDYVWDDVPEIAQNAAFDRPLLEGLALTQTERAEPQLADLPELSFAYDSYRPLLYASFWLDIRLWGRAPGPLHAVNVALGGLAIVAAYLLARRWLRSEWALLPTALFALHPVQIESVAYISGRGDVLAGLFAMLAAYACLRRWTIAAALAFAASLLAKESYVALPLALAALAATHRVRWRSVTVLVIVAIGYLVLRAHMVTTASSPRIGAALLAFPGYVVEYLRVVLLPFDLSIERAPRDFALLGWLLVAASATLVLVLYRRHGLPSWGRDMLTGLVWMIVLLGPSAIVIFTMHVLADRYVYTSLLGLGIAVAAAGRQLWHSRRRLGQVAAASLALWAGLVLFVAWRQVNVWRDVDSLYRHTAEIEPDSSRAQYRVAYLEIARDRWDLAVPRLEQALALDPRNSSALNNLGVYRLRTGLATEAEALLLRAIAANPARFNSWLNLGLAQIAQGKRDAGCACIAHSLTINPRFDQARSEQARLCR